MQSFRFGLCLLQFASVVLAHLRGRGDPPAANASVANASASRALASAAKAGDDCCYTDITSKLQGFIDGDRGLVVRSPEDSGVDSPHKPGTFWSNSVYTPNQMYIWNEDDQEFQYWKAHLAIVVADEHMDDLLGGTYYGHDANACDSADSGTTRCYWEADNNRWNCPGGFKYVDGTWTDDSSAGGAGWLMCQGCHFANGAEKDFDQDMNSDFVGDYNCNCPSNVADDNYGSYVDRILAAGYMNDEAWEADKNICWVDNAFAMGQIQNQLWWKYMQANQLSADDTKDKYWGWNEIAVDAKIDNPYNQYWQAVMVFLPAASELGLTRLSDDEQWDFHKRLKEYRLSNRINPGLAHIAERPGSYIVMAKEEDDGSGSGNFRKQFFCEEWELPGAELKICFKNQDGVDHGYCYVEVVGCDCGVGC